MKSEASTPKQTITKRLHHTFPCLAIPSWGS